jgi:hypothetical protein
MRCRRSGGQQVTWGRVRAFLHDPHPHRAGCAARLFPTCAYTLDTFNPRDMVLLGLADETSDEWRRQTLPMVTLCTSLDDHGPPPPPLVHDLCCIDIICGTGHSRETTTTLPMMRRIDSGYGQIAAVLYRPWLHRGK